MKKIDFNSYEQGRADGIKEAKKINWYGIFLCLVLVLIITGVIIYPLWKDLPKRVCIDKIWNEMFTISYKIGQSTKIYEKNKVVEYLCEDGVEIYDGGDKLFFEFSWTDVYGLTHQGNRDLSYTCIIKLKEKTCEIQ